MLNVVYVTPDVVGERMAGPGIRAWHLASELARRFPTTLIARTAPGEWKSPFEVIEYRSAKATDIIRGAEVLVGQPVSELLRARRDQRIVFDLFDPNVLELQELYGPRPRPRETLHLHREWSRLRRALNRGDLLVCATERQRDFYSGVRAGMRKIDRQWMDRWLTIPFGVEATPPPQSGAVDDSEIPSILWGGGAWEWLDPLTAISAVRVLNGRGLACRLLFLGGKRPNEAVPDSTQVGALQEAIRGAEDTVRINSEWIPYRQRGKWLRSSKVSIMLHRRTPEAEYSIRTRMFDAIWAGVPVVSTEGGWAAELVAREGIGLVVPPGDVESVAAAVERLVRDDVFHASCVLNLERIRPEFLWEKVSRPLVEALQRWQHTT